MARKYSGYPVEGIYMHETEWRKHPALLITAETPYDYIEFIKEGGYIKQEEGNFLHGKDHGECSSISYGSKSFYGTNSFSEWTDMLLNGWHEGAKQAAEIQEELVPYLFGTKIVEDTFKDYEGDEVDIDAYLQNDPECMINTREAHVSGGAKFLKLGVNLSVNSMISANAMMWRGILVAALVDTLETHGYRLDVYGYDFTRGRGGSHRLTMLPVKTSEQPADLERLASLIGHASSLRRGIFAADEKLPRHLFLKYLSRGYGGAVSEYPIDLFPCDLYIGDDCLCTNAKDAATRFKEKLQELPDFYEMIKDQEEEHYYG
jgi:hypothetical protein